jgi:hypothetical protein
MPIFDNRLDKTRPIAYTLVIENVWNDTFQYSSGLPLLSVSYTLIYVTRTTLSSDVLFKSRYLFQCGNRLNG